MFDFFLVSVLHAKTKSLRTKWLEFFLGSLSPFCIKQDPKSGKNILWFTSQKTKYIYDAEEKKQFQPVSFPVDYPFREYQDWKGYTEEEELAKAKDIYGDNSWVT